jgi:hypothetical protein
MVARYRLARPASEQAVAAWRAALNYCAQVDHPRDVHAAELE